MAKWTPYKCNNCNFSFTGLRKPDALIRGKTIPVVCKTCNTNEYTKWYYEKKKCTKCIDGIIGEREGRIITMTD